MGSGLGTGLIIIWPAPNMKLQLYHPPINICYLLSFQVFFFSRFRVLIPLNTRVVPPTQCRNPSNSPSENPFNNFISSISSWFIIVYLIFTTTSNLFSLRYCHFLHRNHIFTYLQTGMILCWFVFICFVFCVLNVWYFFQMLICLVWGVSLSVSREKWEIWRGYLGLSFLLGSL